MMQTSIICGLGILVFLISSFPPIRRFSLMMAALLLLALVGDLVLMPALLASPLGHFFVSSRGAHGLRQQNRPRHDPIACHAEGLE
jgi:hypothetical protein